MTSQHARENAELIQLNVQVQRALAELWRLYGLRAGRVMWSDSDGPTAEAWCRVCGRELVRIDAGFETCAACTEGP